MENVRTFTNCCSAWLPSSNICGVVLLNLLAIALVVVFFFVFDKSTCFVYSGAGKPFLRVKEVDKGSSLLYKIQKPN